MNLSWRRLGGHHLGLGLSGAHCLVEKAGEEVLPERWEKHMAGQEPSPAVTRLQPPPTARTGVSAVLAGEGKRDGVGKWKMRRID